MKKIILCTTIGTLLLMASCSTQQNNTTPGQPQNGSAQKGPPSVDEIFKMDTNQDGQLSKSEVKGPLLNDFDKIDTDGNGFISRTELENAPKPQQGQRPPRRQ